MKKIELPEFIRLSHYRIKLIKINSHICYEIGEQQGSFHSKQMIIYLDEDIIEDDIEQERQFRKEVSKYIDEKIENEIVRRAVASGSIAQA